MKTSRAAAPEATMNTTAPGPAIKLEVHACAARRSYLVTFTGPEAEVHALAFIEARTMTHAFDEAEDEGARIDARYAALIGRLYPSCEHGLSASLCAGPGHYSDHL